MATRIDNLKAYAGGTIDYMIGSQSFTLTTRSTNTRCDAEGIGKDKGDFPVGFDVKNAMDLLKFSPDSHSGPMVLPHFLTEVFDIPLKHSRQKLEEIPHNIRAALTRFLSHRDGVINMLTEEEFVSVHRIITQPYNRMGMYPGIVPGLHKLLQILKKHAETRDMDKEEEEWN